MINRRDILQLGVTSATVSLLPSVHAHGDISGDEDDPTRWSVIDTNVSLFHWPFRRLPLDETSVLVSRIRQLGIEQAWAGSFEGLLHRDLGTVNLRLAKECREYPELVAIGSVNPTLPDWEEDVRRCVDVHKMPGIRLYPNYHGYSLDDPRFGRLLELATKAGVFVQLAVSMEDTRTQHPMLRVPDVELDVLAERLPRVPAARLQLLNYRPRSPLFENLAKTPGLYFDTARVDGTDGVPSMVQRAPAGRVMLGTHAPFLIPEAAIIRTHESGLLDERSLQAILSRNAGRLLSNG